MTELLQTFTPDSTKTGMVSSDAGAGLCTVRLQCQAVQIEQARQQLCMLRSLRLATKVPSVLHLHVCTTHNCLCRFVNCQASKWQFRAGQIEQAEKTAMFTKDGDQANNLHDMQCMWYEIECGQAHLHLQNYGKVCHHKHIVSDSLFCNIYCIGFVWSFVYRRNGISLLASDMAC